MNPHFISFNAMSLLQVYLLKFMLIHVCHIRQVFLLCKISVVWYLSSKATNILPEGGHYRHVLLSKCDCSSMQLLYFIQAMHLHDLMDTRQNPKCLPMVHV